VWSQNTAGLIRLGILALPLGALLGFVGNLGGLSTPDPGDDPAGAAQAASTTGYFLIQFIGNVLGPTLGIFGVIALFAYLLHTRGGRLAPFALVLSILGFSLLLSFLGIITYAIPALGQAYVNGQQNALQMTDALFNGKVFVVVTLSGLFIFLGFGLFGVAIWRSETLPKWAGIILAVAGLLLGWPVNVPFLSLLGTLLSVIAGGWIAVEVLRRPLGQAEGAQAQPRVR
jgi:hypothetical protein